MELRALLETTFEFAQTIECELEENGFLLGRDFEPHFEGERVVGVMFFDADCLRWVLDQMEGE